MFLLTTINTLPYYQRNYRYVLIKRIDKGFKLQFSQKVPKSCIAPTSYLKSELYTYEHIFIIHNSIETLTLTLIPEIGTQNLSNTSTHKSSNSIHIHKLHTLDSIQRYMCIVCNCICFKGVVHFKLQLLALQNGRGRGAGG